MDLLGKNIPEERIDEIINTVRKKKELSTVSESIILSELELILKKDGKILASVSEGKSYPLEFIVKTIRAILRERFGVFLSPKEFKERKETFEKLIKDISNIDIYKKLLGFHASTKERLPIYEKLYERIFAITGKPHHISDLGCGMNPFSLPFMDLGHIHYFATDIDGQMLGMIEKFFSTAHVHAVVGMLNLRNTEEYKLIQPSDVCFLFKLLDSIETKGHTLAEKLIKAIPSQWIVASFSTITMSGKKMNHPERGWIEQMLKRLGYKYEKLSFENEIFYVIKKSSSAAPAHCS